MGKKSRKGQSRAGTKARPKAGKGGSVRRKAADGSSIASGDAMSIDSNEILPSFSGSADNGTNDTAAKKSYASAVTGGIPTSVLTPVKQEKKSPTDNVPTTETEAAAAASLVGLSQQQQQVTEKMEEKKEELATKVQVATAKVEETTSDAVAKVEEAKKPTAATKPVAPLPETAPVVVATKALPSLDQPAEAEQQIKQKDCECVIL
mmetsp:Transcript_12188/g.33823  ORF Transcript_12188/g.33823 Transcript_12188/m.33823 type:complete len:206 (+) Transcript_12188:186-803(+)